MLFDLFGYPLIVGNKNKDFLVEYVSGQKNWFHTFKFDCGIVTPGRDPSARKLHHLCLPSRLDGLSVLDIGAYEGYFSFHALQRGAEKVVASDHFVWTWPESTARDNFNAIQKTLNSRVLINESKVENLAVELHEKYDITLFLGVLYHAPNMIEYLTNVFHVTKKVCIIETLVDALSEPTARAALYAPSEINNDSSNWWAPNLKALAIMLRRVGFSRIDFMNIWYLNSKDKTSKIAWEEPVTTGRVVLHAYV